MAAPHSPLGNLCQLQDTQESLVLDEVLYPYVESG